MLYLVIRSPQRNQTNVTGRTSGRKVVLNTPAMFYDDRITLGQRPTIAPHAKTEHAADQHGEFPPHPSGAVGSPVEHIVSTTPPGVTLKYHHILQTIYGEQRQRSATDVRPRLRLPKWYPVLNQGAPTILGRWCARWGKLLCGDTLTWESEASSRFAGSPVLGGAGLWGTTGAGGRSRPTRSSATRRPARGDRQA